MEVHGEAEELDLGLHIGDFHAQKLIRQQDKSVPRLQLSFALCSPQQEQEQDQKNELIRIRKNGDDNNNDHSSRKKLRLTKEQSTLLECSFKQHTTLNTAQKHALAEQLNLTPRQVEVWFQNRRARTKLKQTEVDCEFLKKCCESLSDENTRLKRELQELKSQNNRKSSQLCLNSSSCM